MLIKVDFIAVDEKSGFHQNHYKSISGLLYKLNICRKCDGNPSNICQDI